MEFKLAVFLAGTLYVVWMLVEVATNYALTLTGVALQENGFIVGVIISKIVMYILLLIMGRYTKADYMANLPFKYWLSLFTVPVVTIFIIHNSFMITVGSDRSVFFFTSTVLLIWVNYMIFDVYNRLGKQMLDDRRLLIYEQQLKICEQQANTREQAYQETARLRHDLKQYLLALFTDIEAKSLSERHYPSLLSYTQESIARTYFKNNDLSLEEAINFKETVFTTPELAPKNERVRLYSCVNCEGYLTEQINKIKGKNNSTRKKAEGKELLDMFEEPTFASTNGDIKNDSSRRK